MNVVYSDRAKQSGQGYVALQQATRQLEKVVGPSASRVNAEWDLKQNANGQVVYALHLSDAPDSASAEFLPDELQSENDLLFRLYSVWGDVLRKRSHRYLKGLREPEE